MNPEERAREKIDEKLEATGWVVHLDFKGIEKPAGESRFLLSGMARRFPVVFGPESRA
jgi:hypothetical protein